MRRWAVIGLGLAGVALGLACARGNGTTGAEPPGDSPKAPVAVDVVAVHPGLDDRSLAMDLQLLDGAPDCGSGPQLGYNEWENGRVFANVVVDAPGSLIYGHCPGLKIVTATLHFDYVVAGLPLTTNNSQSWDPATPDYRLCDPVLGCHPPADHCARVWTNLAVFDLDTPQHSYVNTVHCDQTWLVLQIDRNAGACGAGRPACSVPPATVRYFLRWDDRWRLVASSQSAGCPEAVVGEPGFPVPVCDGLPALP
ncbi:MAG TPA: hypothetical protein VH561_04825 [Micromonosporaceae bacterium]